jgi:hypothetical protein
MKWASEDEKDSEIVEAVDDRMVIFDVEVYKNLFVSAGNSEAPTKLYA